jgi:hypothetical protein
MKLSSRARRFGLFVLALHTAGCFTWHTATIAPAELLASGNRGSLRVTRQDSTGAGSARIVLLNPILRGDVLEGTWRLRADSAVVVRIPIKDVQEIATQKFRPWRTLGLSVVVLGGTFVLLIWYAFAHGTSA